MFFSRYVFSKEFFTGWVVVGIIWTFLSTLAVVVYPIYESTDALKLMGKAIWADVRGKRNDMILSSQQPTDQQMHETGDQVAYIATEKSKEVV
jgi:hypothetical protein